MRPIIRDDIQVDVIGKVWQALGEQRLTTEMVEVASRLMKHNRCRHYVDRQGRMCRQRAVERCQRSTLIAAKVVRTSLVALERTLQRVPDVNVVYYTRDPRAMALSRHIDDMTFSGRDAGVSAEAKILCVQMLDDIRSLKRLERKYPGAFISLRYEDLVRDPFTTVNTLFRHAGTAAPLLFKSWVKSVMHASKDGGRFSVIRANASATAERWRKVVSLEDVQVMNEDCAEVLAELSYII